jgi:phosphoribulokinase
MSQQKHPIIAITGSAGAGTTTVREAFEDIFERGNINAGFINGDAFRRYDYEGMRQAMQEADQQGRVLSHFGPAANLFPELENLFREYSASGRGKTRYYTNEENAETLGTSPGTFTDWQDLPPGSDLLFYEGLHGGVVSSSWTRRRMSSSHNPRISKERRRHDDNGIDVAQYVDLLIGVVPVINLEWIQKIHKVREMKGLSAEAVTKSILRSLDDYVHYITPQFSFTDINFQRVPLVDTSNPFIAREVPSDSESILVIRFREPGKHDLLHIKKSINDARFSRPNTLVVPGGCLRHAMRVICEPIINRLVKNNS